MVTNFRVNHGLSNQHPAPSTHPHPRKSLLVLLLFKLHSILYELVIIGNFWVNVLCRQRSQVKSWRKWLTKFTSMLRLMENLLVCSFLIYLFINAELMFALGTCAQICVSHCSELMGRISPKSPIARQRCSYSTQMFFPWLVQLSTRIQWLCQAGPNLANAQCSVLYLSSWS